MTVLHYTGADEDRGGIHAVVRALASADLFECVLGVNPGFVVRRSPTLPTLTLPAIMGETLKLATIWRARGVAVVVRDWLAADSSRIFHGHSRAGLAVALWLARGGERRVVVSVHCYGRQRWFYRWAAGRLGDRLFWLTPAMKRYYGVAGAGTWAQCVPSCAMFAPVGDERVPATNGVVRLGGIGALVSWKGWHLVLEALARLPAATRERLRFAQIGSSEDSVNSRRYAAALRDQAAALGLMKYVTWRGEEPSSAALLRQTDCLVIPSHNEPFSVAMIEALAAGVPVLAADSGGPPDVITPPHDGWLFRTGDAADLSRMFSALVLTDALRAVQISPEKLRRFSAPVVAGVWQETYGRVLR